MQFLEWLFRPADDGRKNFGGGWINPLPKTKPPKPPERLVGPTDPDVTAAICVLSLAEQIAVGPLRESRGESQAANFSEGIAEAAALLAIASGADLSDLDVFESPAQRRAIDIVLSEKGVIRGERKRGSD